MLSKTEAKPRCGKPWERPRDGTLGKSQERCCDSEDLQQVISLDVPAELYKPLWLQIVFIGLKEFNNKSFPTGEPDFFQ